MTAPQWETVNSHSDNLLDRIPFGTPAWYHVVSVGDRLEQHPHCGKPGAA